MELLEPVSAKITVGRDAGGPKEYDLAVVDHSRHGLGLLVTRNEFDILEELSVGDQIQDMVLYAPWAVTKVDGKVANKTELQDGDHKGCFMLRYQIPRANHKRQDKEAVAICGGEALLL